MAPQKWTLVQTKSLKKKSVKSVISDRNNNSTRNERKVCCPVIYTDTIRNAILFIDTPKIPGPTKPIRQYVIIYVRF